VLRRAVVTRLEIGWAVLTADLDLVPTHGLIAVVILGFGDAAMPACVGAQATEGSVCHGGVPDSSPVASVGVCRPEIDMFGSRAETRMNFVGVTGAIL
jgi:hypothetical protein